MRVLSVLLLLALQHATTRAFDYQFDEENAEPGLALLDVKTGISDIKTIHTKQAVAVTITDLAFIPTEEGVETPDSITWETSVDGKVQASGTFDLTDVGRELPTEIEAGEIVVESGGRPEIVVKLSLGDTSLEASGEFESYAAGVSIIPLIFVLVMAASTRMVELSLFCTIFVGSCIVNGSIIDGFKELLNNYILQALADEDHGYVYLFTLFLSGLVGMLEKSGGMSGFTRDVQRFAKAPRSGQFACFGIGIFVFFDDYANVLLAGETMRPLLDMLCVSREKLAFIVDATAAPIASISPISSWVGFEVYLIQEQINRLEEIHGEGNLSIKDSGLAVFLQSIKYRYYPIFMIVLMVALIWSQRDFGTMLIAERKTEVYQQKDGGDGKGLNSTSGVEKHNQPEAETPARTWNMIVPVLFLVFFIFYMLIKTGEVDGEDQSVMDKIENSNSYQALLWGTMAAAIVTMLMYLLQPVQGGNIVWSLAGFKGLLSKGEGSSTFLLTVGESVEAFLFGMGRIFPALIVLTLAWASGAIMIDVGADRLFSSWIVGGISPEALPTLSFVISFFMALATGTSWGTMSILFPLILVPTYDASGGDAIIFYSVTAGVLSGSVAGDHVSPISDTTVLTSLACDCKLLAHVVTQAPYVIVTVLVSMLLGTIPIGYSDWPNIVGILLGALLIVLFVYFICVPVLSPTGRYDILTELYLSMKLKRGQESELVQLREDTKLYVQGELPMTSETPKKLGSDSEAGTGSEKGAEVVVVDDIMEAGDMDDVELDGGVMKDESTRSLGC